MRRLARLSGWPGPAWLLPALSAAVAVSTFFTTRRQLAAAYPLWTAVSAAWHESLWITGALVAAAAAGLACLLFPRHSALDLPTRPKVDMVLLLRHGGLIGGWALLGHVIGLIPIHVAALDGATQGRLSIADVVIGAVGIVLLAVVGFAVGALARSVIVVPVVGLVLFGLMGLPMEPLFRPIGLVLPVRQITASPRFETSAFTAVFAVLSAVGISGAVASLTMWARHRSSVRAHRGAAVAWAGLGVALIAVAFAWRPEMYVVDRPVPTTCSDHQGATVCLHQANLPAAGEVTRTVDALQRAGLSTVMARVSDAAAVDRDVAQRGEALVYLDPGPFDDYAYASTVREQVADQIVNEYTVAGCVSDPGSTIANYDVQRALRQRILELSGFDALTEGEAPVDAAARKAFAQMEPPQIARFLAEHESQIRGCALSPADVST